jgi:hypothetical protein
LDHQSSANGSQSERQTIRSSPGQRLIDTADRLQ